MIHEGDTVRISADAETTPDGTLPGMEGQVMSIDGDTAFIDFGDQCPYGYQFIPLDDLQEVKSWETP
jgi:hypothetical protein